MNADYKYFFNKMSGLFVRVQSSPGGIGDNQDVQGEDSKQVYCADKW